MRLMTLALALAVFVQDKNPDTLKITAEFDNATIGEILDSLKTLTGIPVELDEAAQKKVDTEARLSFKVQDTTLTNAVKLLFTNRGVEVKVVDKSKILVSVPKAK